MSRTNNPAQIVQPPTLAEQAKMMMAFLKVLYVNGQTTGQIMAVAETMAKSLGKHSLLKLQWDGLWLRLHDEDGCHAVVVVSAEPVMMHMGKVVDTMEVLAIFFNGKLSLAEAYARLLTIDRQPPAKTWLFGLATAMCSLALAIIFGLRDYSAAELIFFSGALGAVVRRYLATISTNLFLQPLVAALIAGIIGAVAVQANISHSLRLVALCPCMVLVPGAHLLNGALDLIRGRLPLGMARLMFALLVCVSISLGVLTGMGILHSTIPIEPITDYQVPLWQDMVAAAIAIFGYCVFFSMPFKLILWPMGLGMLGHALRWLALASLGAQVPTADFLTCLFVSSVLTLVAYYQRLSFAAVAFAAVVSMMPGVYIFRMISGFTELTRTSSMSFVSLSETVYVGLNALSILVAISIGLLVPKLLIDTCLIKKL